jgi:hypothetical protein
MHAVHPLNTLSKWWRALRGRPELPTPAPRSQARTPSDESLCAALAEAESIWRELPSMHCSRERGEPSQH